LSVAYYYFMLYLFRPIKARANCASRSVLTQDLLGYLIQHDSCFFLDFVSDFSYFLYRFPFWILNSPVYCFVEQWSRTESFGTAAHSARCILLGFLIHLFF